MLSEVQYKGPVCRGSWALGNNCKICERCIATKPTNPRPPMTEITPEALEALNQKATQGLIEVLLPDTEYDHGVPLIATDYPGTFGPSNGLVLWATMQPTEIEAKDTECAEANAAFAAALWNAYRTGQLILAQPSGDEVEAVALAILNSDRGMRGLDPLESRENVPDSDGYVTNATAAITTYEAVSGVVNTIALQEVTQIATYLWRKHYRDDAPDWRPLPDLRGVISQIDNMVTGLTRARAALGEKP